MSTQLSQLPNIQQRKQTDSQMSIPVFDGSMMSVRDSSVRYQSALPTKSAPLEIKWKIGKLEKKYECNYCNSYLKFPVQFQDCRHRVCSSCLTEILKSSSACPTCDRAITREKVVIDNEFQKEMNNLQVYCSNNLSGCKWSGTFKELNPHTDECQFSIIECNRGCKQKYMRKNESKHLQEDCIKNEYRCDFCKQGIAKALEAQHLGVCPKFILPCPHNCGVKDILRENMQTHLDNECPNHEISCPFVDSNCEFKSLRPAMAKHLKESPGIHLNLMCKTISSQKKAMILLGEVVDQQKEMLMSLHNKLNTMERFYGSQLIWKIDNFAQKYNDAKSGVKSIIFSPAFLTSRHGYKLALSAALYGDGKAKGKFMSVFLCICKGDFDSLLEWPFNHKISLTLLDQAENIEARQHVTYVIKPNPCKENKPFLGRPTGDRNASFGAQRFVELDIVNSNNYIMENSIFIKVEIDTENMTLI